MERIIYIIFPLFFVLITNVGANGYKICVGRCPSTVTFFIDKEAKKDLEKYKVTPRRLLKRIQYSFWKYNELSIGYDFKNILVEEWRHDRAELYPVGDFAFELLYLEQFENKNLRKEMRERYLRDSSDITIFLSGNIILGSGLAQLQQGKEGHGYILIGTAYNELFTGFVDIGESRIKSNRRFYKFLNLDPLDRLAFVGAHEQVHLYGLNHSDNENSLMYSRTNSNFVLDPKQKIKLKNILYKY